MDISDSDDGSNSDSGDALPDWEPGKFRPQQHAIFGCTPQVEIWGGNRDGENYRAFKDLQDGMRTMRSRVDFAEPGSARPRPIIDTFPEHKTHEKLYSKAVQIYKANASPRKDLPEGLDTRFFEWRIQVAAFEKYLTKQEKVAGCVPKKEKTTVFVFRHALTAAEIESVRVVLEDLCQYYPKEPGFWDNNAVKLVEDAALAIAAPRSSMIDLNTPSFEQGKGNSKDTEGSGWYVQVRYSVYDPDTLKSNSGSIKLYTASFERLKRVPRPPLIYRCPEPSQWLDESTGVPRAHQELAVQAAHWLCSQVHRKVSTVAASQLRIGLSKELLSLGNEGPVDDTEEAAGQAGKGHRKGKVGQSMRKS